MARVTISMPNAVMRVWKVCIRPDLEAPDLAQGYVLAESKDDALAVVD